jgi:hypothetical protein
MGEFGGIAGKGETVRLLPFDAVKRARRNGKNVWRGVV